MEIVKPTRIVDREPHIVEWFKSGKAITEIAAILSEELGTTVSYQAVHRIIKKNGLGRKDGGKSVQTTARKEEEAKQKVEKLDARYGCTDDQWKYLRGLAEAYKDTPLAAYNTFKNNFKNLYPDIPFELTLWDWWSMWEESGKWGQHKRNPKGMFVMTFVDALVPFAKNNARIMAFSDLLREQRAPKVKKAEAEEDPIPA